MAWSSASWATSTSARRWASTPAWRRRAPCSTTRRSCRAAARSRSETSVGGADGDGDDAVDRTHSRPARQPPPAVAAVAGVAPGGSGGLGARPLPGVAVGRRGRPGGLLASGVPKGGAAQLWLLTLLHG